jgi:hypothetical protein
MTQIVTFGVPLLIFAVIAMGLALGLGMTLAGYNPVLNAAEADQIRAETAIQTQFQQHALAVQDQKDALTLAQQQEQTETNLAADRLWKLDILPVIMILLALAFALSLIAGSIIGMVVWLRSTTDKSRENPVQTGRNGASATPWNQREFRKQQRELARRNERQRRKVEILFGEQIWPREEAGTDLNKLPLAE